MNTRTKIINVLIRSVFACIALCLTAQLLIIVRGVMDRILWDRFLINYCVAYPAACILGMTVPAADFGKWVCKKLNVYPGIGYRIVMSLASNLIFTAILSTIMTFLNTVILNGQNLSAVIPGIIQNFIPMWLASGLVAMLIDTPVRKLTVLLAGSDACHQKNES